MKNNKTPNHLKDIALLIFVPITTIILIASIVYIPRLIANPQYDFVYSVCDSYMCSNSYTVDSFGHILESENSKETGLSLTSLRYFNTKNNSFSIIGSQELNNYNLVNSSKSPDGYTFSGAENINGALFFRNSDNGWYLKNGLLNKRLDLVSGDYYGDIKFLGWVSK